MALKFYRVSAAAIFGICGVVSSSALAGGFDGSFNSPIGTVSAKALATNYSRLTSNSGYARTKTYAKVGQYAINGDILKGFAESGNKVEIYVDGKRCNNSCQNGRVVVDQKSVAKAKIYIKNKNMLAKAYAKNYVKLTVEGEVKFENEEYSYAQGRFTPLGTIMKAGARNSNQLQAKGLVRLSTGQVVRVSGQVNK